MTKATIINHKRYTVEHVFNMVGNWEFTDKHNVIHLVDGEDVAVWADDENIKKGIDTAIAYAKYIASINDGEFWWKRKYYVPELERYVYNNDIERYL